jgi:hypothetical protein
MCYRGIITIIWVQLKKTLSAYGYAAFVEYAGSIG